MMKRTFSIILAAFMVQAFLACGGPKGPSDMPGQKQAVNPQTPLDVPAWFANVPEEDDTYIYATGVGDSRRMNIAINKAKQDAMVQLSERVKAKVKSMVKQMTQEAGMDENTQVVDFYQQASTTITNNTFSGITVLKQYPYQKTGGGYRVYMLIGLKKQAFNKALANTIQNEAALYSEWKATQAFKELEKQTSGE